MRPEVSFITICYNGFKDTCELIESIIKNVSSIEYEIIVVDNASFNNEAMFLKQEYPTIKAIRSEKNLGFSGGNNLGIKKAIGNFLFLINNDTFIETDNINNLINRLKNNSTIAGVSPKIKFADSPEIIQFAGFSKLTSITLRNKTIGLGQKDSECFNIPKPTPYLHGAAMMIKKEVIEKVGLMPEIYFLYYEEIDWSTNMTRNGYELWYEPSCTIFHKESRSTGKESNLKTFYLTRNRLLYAWRNLKRTNKYLSIIYQITIVFFKECINFILKGNSSYISVTLKGIVAFFLLKDKRK